MPQPIVRTVAPCSPGASQLTASPMVSFQPCWRPWLLQAPSVSLPCHSLAHEPPRAMPGLWGHSTQTTTCFRVTSAVPVGVGQPGKGLENQPGRLFKQKSVISFRRGKGRGKNTPHGPPGLRELQSPSWVPNFLRLKPSSFTSQSVILVLLFKRLYFLYLLTLCSILCKNQFYLGMIFM